MRFYALTLASILVVAPATQLPAQRTGRCIVSDPTSTQLNVRSEPQGKIMFSLPNGYPVYIEDIGRDYKGQPWALVRDWRTKETLGWVFREFISCY